MNNMRWPLHHDSVCTAAALATCQLLSCEQTSRAYVSALHIPLFCRFSWTNESFFFPVYLTERIGHLCILFFNYFWQKEHSLIRVVGLILHL